MNKARKSFLVCIGLLCTFFVNFLQGQPLPCVTNEMTSFCEDACIICDIDGFKGRHDSAISGSLPGDFCTTTVHNAQWIAFIAGSEDLAIELTPSNCQRGFGLEMTVYFSRDCSTFRKVFNCDGDVRSGQPRVFRNTEPLIIGQYYFLTMDGNGGDNCDWVLKVLEGTTLVAPLENSGKIIGSGTACPGIPVTYQVEKPVGATEFYWSINGISQDVNRDEVELVFPQSGDFTICVESANACDIADPTCKVISVNPIPPTSISPVICTGDSLFIDSIPYFETGQYEIHITLDNNCDSIIMLDLLVQDISITDAKVNICAGDELKIGEDFYNQTGQYEIHLQSQYHCDSIINLDLFIVECQIDGISTSTDASCHSFNDGETTFSVQNGTPTFSFEFKNLVGEILESGNGLDLDEERTVSNLAFGTYFAEIKDNFSNQEIIIINIEQPQPIITAIETSDYNGYQVACFDGHSGNISLSPSGGIGDYTYAWSNGDITAFVDNLSAGSYDVRITDENNCPAELEITLNEPEPIDADVVYLPSGCDDNISGMIHLQNIEGGVPTYSTKTNNSTYKNVTTYDGLSIGLNSVSIKDTNGCILTIEDEIRSSQIPDISLVDQIEISLGDSVILSATTNDINIDNIEWFSSEGVSCLNCLETSSSPLRSNYYKINIISEDGCARSDSVFVSVIREQKVFAPNIFSPSAPSSYFRLTLGNDVQQVGPLLVYDRWGNLVFENDNETGWDGNFNGEKASDGVYVWKANVTFIDGVSEIYYGDITLLNAKY